MKMLKRSPLKKKSTLQSKSTLNSTSNLQSRKSLTTNIALHSNKSLGTKQALKKANLLATKRWKNIREVVLIRDNYRCIVCKKPATQVHHIHLRSHRKDLVYELNNLVSLCSDHHFHKGSEKYKEQTELIAYAKNKSVADLLAFAETKSQ
jgi:5-methylcytosine-specific restriction endonuclease McrA